MMITKISWRNIWRNKVRSGILIASIAVGLLAGIFSMALISGMMDARIQEALNTELSHVQIHQSGFEMNYNIKDSIPSANAILQQSRQMPEVQAASGRVVVNGMVSSANDSRGIRIIGMDPEEEQKVTEMKSYIIDGDYFEGKRKNQIVIGKRLADKLKVKIRSKVVLGYMGPDQEMINTAYRIAGVFATSSPDFDEGTVFTQSEDMWRNSGYTFIHEIAVKGQNGGNNAEVLADSLQRHIANNKLSIQSWKALAPELSTLANSGNVQSYLLLGIILFALGFGILNSMTMAIFERSREIGVLMAVGLERGKVFLMILYETIYLSLIGSAIGGFFCFFLIQYYAKNGLKYAESSMAGFSNIVYPALPDGFLIPLLAMILATAILSALPPAFKAIRMNPSEAIRHKG
ncbi:ABC transporter permease [Persicobacter diffluens]|uniref:ABC transporter permease n=1 Tax=Persicobacter diffluens TaxID=981 RepID=A0AAN4W3S4_9BACT|nr:ABC transporter permease [Persicobacter diffluens]